MVDREAIARLIVARWARRSILVSVIPLPLVDFVGITALQLKMLRELSQHYEVPYSQERGRLILGAILGGGVATRLGWSSLRTIAMGVPGVGTLAGIAVMHAFGSLSTSTVGRLFIQHFERGGTLGDFDPAEDKDDLGSGVENRLATRSP